MFSFVTQSNAPTASKRCHNTRALDLSTYFIDDPDRLGIGLINAMALIHTLGDVRRFRRKEEVVAFVGLDPLEKSSGETRRMGSISKHGSRLVRHLLGQAAQACRDRRIRQFYLEVSRRRGRPKAKVAAARKLLINCYVMLRDNISYEEFTRRGEVGLYEGSGEVTGKPAQSLKV